jgi:hypothetical protein
MVRRLIKSRRFLTLFLAIRNRRKTIILFTLAVLTVELPLLHEDFPFEGWILFCGIALFFYTFLHPWESKSKYYYMKLMGISVILPLLAIFVIDLPEFLIKINHGIASVFNITNTPRDDGIIWTFYFICLAAFFAGLIGLVLPSED